MDVGAAVIFQNKDRARPDRAVYRDDLHLADLAEPLGFDSLWSVEHHFTDYTMCPDVMQLLAYFAGRTQRIRLGSMVIVLPWHHPARAAEEIAMLDHLCGGRTILGIGRGIGRIEFEGLGIDQNESRQRFVETARAVLDALESGRIAYEGELIRQPLRDIRPEPFKSFRSRTYAAAMSPESATIVADLGAGVLVIPQKPWEEHGRDLTNYRARFLEVHGRPAPPPIAVCWTLCHEDEGRARELAEHYLVDYYLEAAKHYELGGHHFDALKGHEEYARWSAGIRSSSRQAVGEFFLSLQVWGTPQQCYDKILDIRRKFGNDHFVGVFSYANLPAGEAERSMRAFATQVLPRLKALPAQQRDAA
jgi:alkanesulfonate monooxygenase SsuD/methylene tetrahydromethanopterin reductase-like flavin-dependent oxidoreductase (luciferase family)